jgi:uncharacterized protein YerC
MVQTPSTESHSSEKVYPIGIVLLAGIARKTGHEAAVLDMNLHVDAFGALKERLLDFQPHVVGLSLRNIDPLGNKQTSLVIPFVAAARLVASLLPRAVILAYICVIWQAMVLQSKMKRIDEFEEDHYGMATRGGHMINDSSLERWGRLEHKSLDQQFVREIVQGLNCSPFEAGAVLDAVHHVYGNYFETSPALKPGQMKIQVLAVEAKVGQAISESMQTIVVLTVNDDEEDLNVRQQGGVVALRRHKIERLCREAFDQGGLLTVEDLANRILNCGERTVCRDLAYFRNNDIFIPLRSTVKDIGRTLSHRLLIIKLWAQGKEYTEISRETRHSPSAVQNYVDKFKRTVVLSREGYDAGSISFLLRISTPLVEKYLDLSRSLHFAAHRKRELIPFSKKNGSSRGDLS